MFGDKVMIGNRRQAFAGADPKAFFALADASQFAQRAQRNQMARRELTTLHLRINIRAAGDEHGVGAKFSQSFSRLFQRARLVVFEFR